MASLVTKYTNVWQSGSSGTWVDLSNVNGDTDQPTYVNLTSSVPDSNLINMSVPIGISAVPVGAVFTSMLIQYDVKKSGVNADSASLTTRFGTNLGTVEIVGSVATSEVWLGKQFTGTKSIWGLGSYSGTQLIDYLKDGTLQFYFWYDQTTAVDVQALWRQIILTVNYDVPGGKEGAVLLPMS